MRLVSLGRICPRQFSTRPHFAQAEYLEANTSCLVTSCRRKATSSVKDDIALVGVLSTQRLASQFTN